MHLAGLLGVKLASSHVGAGRIKLDFSFISSEFLIFLQVCGFCTSKTFNSLVQWDLPCQIALQI